MSFLPMPDLSVEEIVIGWLGGGLTAPRKAVTDLPIPLEPRLPLARVIAVPGGAETETTAGDRVEIHNMAATRDAMWALTRETHDLMRRLTELEGGQLIDKVLCPMRPSFLAWSPTVPRSIAVYEVQYRPQLAATV